MIKSALCAVDAGKPETNAKVLRQAARLANLDGA